MATPTLLEKVKAAVRVSTDVLDDVEVLPLIASAKAELILAGVLEAKVVDDDPLIARAILFYAKGNFGLNNPDSEKYRAAFEDMKQKLTLSRQYTEAT
jgi:hypothetical protein